MKSEFKNARILIVDDKMVNIDLLVGILKINGYNNYHFINDSKEVMQSIRENQPDLLLLDLMMPDVSGFDILKMIKADESLHKNMAILVLTADITAEAKHQALQLDANDFLTKPFDIMEVALRIKNLLRTVKLLSELSSHNLVLEEKVKERCFELSTTLEKITKQNQILRDIAYTQSHIVRAPLSRIMGVVYFLQSQAKNEINTIPSHHSNKAENYDFARLMQAIIDSALELDQIIREISEKSIKSKLTED